VITTAARRAVSRLNRSWTAGAVLAAGMAISSAAFLCVAHRENLREEEHLRIALDARMRSIRREIQSRSILLEILARLLQREAFPAESVQDTIDGYRGSRGEAVLALWAPWDGRGEVPRTWSRVRRFASPEPALLLQEPPGWLADVLRRAAWEGRPLCIPATAPDGSELLAFAAPVRDLRGRLKGVAVVVSNLGEVVEHAIANAAPGAVTLVLEDTALGGRRLYEHGPQLVSASPSFPAEEPLEFAGRKWKVRAAPGPGVSAGSAWLRWSLLAAWLAVTTLMALLTRDLSLKPAALATPRGSKIP
jgi:hypothetical protein